MGNDLRHGAIETLRLADHDYTRLETEEHPHGKAGFQLDRLVGFLEDRADEWVSDRFPKPGLRGEVGRNLASGVIRKLLAVLKGTP